MTTYRVELSKEQSAWLERHAEKHKLEPEQDLASYWWHRVQALEDYAEKRATKGAKYHAYAPKGLDAAERERIKRTAFAAGVALKPKPKPAPKKQREAIRRAAKKAGGDGGRLQRIDLYDSPQVALAKARGNAGKSGRPARSFLSAAGRHSDGRRTRP